MATTCFESDHVYKAALSKTGLPGLTIHFRDQDWMQIVYSNGNQSFVSVLFMIWSDGIKIVLIIQSMYWLWICETQNTKDVKTETETSRD